MVECWSKEFYVSDSLSTDKYISILDLNDLIHKLPNSCNDFKVQTQNKSRNQTILKWCALTVWSKNSSRTSKTVQ